MPITPKPLIWRRSSRCGNAACVEVAQTPTAVHLRDSTQPDGPQIVLPPATFRAFLAQIRAGEFDG